MNPNELGSFIMRRALSRAVGYHFGPPLGVVDDESANEYPSNEDVSWQVRRAAAKYLAALIVSQPEMLSRLYKEACSKLIGRFKEQEEMSGWTSSIHLFCYIDKQKMS